MVIPIFFIIFLVDEVKLSMIVCFLSEHFDNMSPIPKVGFSHQQVQKYFEGFEKNIEERYKDFYTFFYMNDIIMLSNDSNFWNRNDIADHLLNNSFYKIDYKLFSYKWEKKKKKINEVILIGKIKIGYFCKVINTIEYLLTHLKFDEELLNKCNKCFKKTRQYVEQINFFKIFINYYDIILSIISLKYLMDTYEKFKAYNKIPSNINKILFNSDEISKDINEKTSELQNKLKYFFGLYKNVSEYSNYIKMKVCSFFYENFQSNFFEFFSKDKNKYLIYLQLFDFRIFEGKLDNLTFDLSDIATDDEEKTIHPSVYLGASLRYLSLKKYFDEYDEEEVKLSTILAKSEEIIQNKINNNYKIQSYKTFKSYFNNFKTNFKNFEPIHTLKEHDRLSPEYLNGLIVNKSDIPEFIINKCFQEIGYFFSPFDNYIHIIIFLYNCLVTENILKNEELKMNIYNNLVKFFDVNYLSKKCIDCFKIPLINRILVKIFLWKIINITGDKYTKSINRLKEFNYIKSLLIKLNITIPIPKQPMEYILILQIIASSYFNLGYYREAKHKYTNILNELSKHKYNKAIKDKINMISTKRLMCLQKLGRNIDNS